jgi:putative addiction module killer protein/probable addiction module antidote protein
MEIRRYLTESGKDVVGEWLTGLKDVRARAKIATRIARLEAGNFGDCKPVGEGVCELRIDWGPGYRVYYAIIGTEIVLLLLRWRQAERGDGHSEGHRVAEGQQAEDDTDMKHKASISHEEAILKELRDDPEYAAEYLKAALEDSDEPKVLLVALRQLAKAHGVAKVAKKAHIERESLYRALSPNGNPRFSTIMAITKALGLTLTVEPVPLR